MNPVSLYMKFLTPDVIARIAAALGLDQRCTSEGRHGGSGMFERLQHFKPGVQRTGAQLVFARTRK
jgi:hypothetical protein